MKYEAILIVSFAKVLGISSYHRGRVESMMRRLMALPELIPSHIRDEWCYLATLPKAKSTMKLRELVRHNWDAVPIEKAQKLVDCQILRASKEAQVLNKVWIPSAPGLTGRPILSQSHIYQSVQFIKTENSPKNFQDTIQRALSSDTTIHHPSLVLHVQELAPGRYEVCLSHRLLISEVVDTLRRIPGVVEVRTIPTKPQHKQYFETIDTVPA